jgi:large subunit ribosomal protein L34e
MPEGRKKSRTLRRIKVKTPGGKTITHYRQRKPGKAKCAKCRKPLAGVAIARATQMNKIPKNQRRPERPFGGVLCSNCLKVLLKNQSRGSNV